MAANHTRLLALQAWQLKRTAFLMGLPSTGTKLELDTTIRQNLSARRLFNGGRIISVDMGIRNLAFCVVDVPSLSAERLLGTERSASPLVVLHWLKKDLLGKNIEDENVGQSPTITAEATQDLTGRRRKPTSTSMNISK